MLNIGILASETSWYYKDLERAARDLGHRCERLDFERLVARVDSVSTSIRQSNNSGDQSAFHSMRSDSPRTESNLDLILVRTMPPGSLEQVVYRMDVLSRVESMGIRVINSPKSLECAVDKFLTTARLQEAGLPVPDTIVCEHEDDAMDAFSHLGSDVVVKPLFGSEGRGIVRVSDPDLAHRTFRTLMRLNSVLYLQKFIDHGGCDIRILVLNGQVIGGMRRRSSHDFRTNVARDAVAEPHQPTREEIEIAIVAAAATGSFISGIDLLYDRDGACYVIEVNAVPGWKAFSQVNQKDIAKQLIEALQHQA